MNWIKCLTEVRFKILKMLRQTHPGLALEYYDDRTEYHYLRHSTSRQISLPLRHDLEKYPDHVLATKGFDNAGDAWVIF
jgi:hypothetical protein